MRSPDFAISLAIPRHSRCLSPQHKGTLQAWPTRRRAAWLALFFLAFVSTLRADFVVFVAPGNLPPTAFLLTTTNNGTSGSSTGIAPASGTPAYNVFNGQVNFLYAPLIGVQENPNHNLVAHVLTGLNSNRRYSLKGTSIRGGSTYTDRWTLFELAGVLSFTNAHTSNCLTSAQVPLIASNQVAINVGANHTANTGDIFDWEDVQPDTNGTLVIYSRQYTGPVPGGSSGGSYSYALSFLRVQEFGTNVGPVLITQHPQSQTIVLGGSASFSVQCVDTGDRLFYQWLKGGVPILTGTNATFTISTVTTNDEGFYSVVASNSISSMTSSNAELVVVPQAPVILSQPVSKFAFVGSNATLSATVRGLPPLHYQWQFGGADIPGATASNLTLTSVQISDTGDYRVIITNHFGTAISSNATLGITTIGEALNCTNLSWSFSTRVRSPWFAQSEVTHDGVLALQSGDVRWRSSLITTVNGPCALRFWLKMSEASLHIWGARPFLVDSLAGDEDWRLHTIYLGAGAGLYEVEWEITRGTAWLDEVTYLSVEEALQFTAGPTNQTVFAGSPTTFSASAVGHPPLRFQWQFNGVEIPEATEPILGIRNTQAEHAGTYSVTVSSPYAAITTSAVLTVQESAPVFHPQRTNLFALPGGEAWLHARASGSDPRRYQWRFEDVEIPGATNEVLKLFGVEMAQTGRYSVVVNNDLGTANGPDIHLDLTEVRHVIHISGDGLASRRLAAGWDAPARFPNFTRLLEEGARTLNARCDYYVSETVPDHVSILTGRPAKQPDGWPNTSHHGYLENLGVPYSMTIHNQGNTNVPYKASVFDVAHDHGLTTAFLASKDKLDVCANSYNAVNGAPDLIEPDHGRSKIDLAMVVGTSSDILVDEVARDFTSGAPRGYTFLHIAELDLVSQHEGITTWYDTLEGVDAMLGRILSAIENSADAAAARQTVVLVTADHGAGEIPHTAPNVPTSYTIPLVAWGPGFPAGADLYALFSNRGDPGTNYVDFNARPQPLWNGDTGNLALRCLGLPTIPGSSLIPVLESASPRLHVQAQGSDLRFSWSRSAMGFVLESSERLGPDAEWTVVPDEIQTSNDRFNCLLARGTSPRFFRLWKAP